MLRQAILEHSPEILLELADKVKRLTSPVIAQLDEVKLISLGLDFSSAEEAFAHFDKSVLCTNSFNSVAGVLANQQTVFFQAATSFFDDGAVSFDAGYQVGYSQLALCEDYREAFYPCGTAAIEVLQPNYENCETIDTITSAMEPNV